MARFKYIGESPNGPFEMYGATWENGTVAEVSDPAFARKLSRNQFFESVDSEAQAPVADVKKKGGRPKKEVTNGDPDPSGTV